MPRRVFRYVGNKTFDFSSKKKDFCPKTTQFGPKLAFLSIAGSFGACWWVGFLMWCAGCLARLLFTLSLSPFQSDTGISLSTCGDLKFGDLVLIFSSPFFDSLLTSSVLSRQRMSFPRFCLDIIIHKFITAY